MAIVNTRIAGRKKTFNSEIIARQLANSFFYEIFVI